jgi:hypothetical protein
MLERACEPIIDLGLNVSDVMLKPDEWLSCWHTVSDAINTLRSFKR